MAPRPRCLLVPCPLLESNLIYEAGSLCQAVTVLRTARKGDPSYFSVGLEYMQRDKDVQWPSELIAGQLKLGGIQSSPNEGMLEMTEDGY